MLVTDHEVKDLKPWLIKKLEAISEADSQILSDYVLALLQADSSEAELRINLIENLTDFLGPNTSKFVDEIFRAIRVRAYVPGNTAPATRPSALSNQLNNLNGALAPSQQYSKPRTSSAGRKRNYEESSGSYIDYDSPVKRQYERNTKQPRRGNGVRRGDSRSEQTRGQFQASNGAGGQFSDPSNGRMRNNSGRDQANGLHAQYSGSPQQTTGYGLPASLPFDPHAALQAVLTLQAMGFPIPLPSPLPETGASANPRNVPLRSNKRCRDYETKGFCPRGATCRFSHDDKTSQAAYENNSIDTATSEVTGREAQGQSWSVNKKDHSRTAKGRAPFSAPMVDGEEEVFSGIVIENIPEEYFDYDSVAMYFSKFGPIYNISMRAYHHLAIVEYEARSSAIAAMHSPDVIFENRFVKVFWYVAELDDKRETEAGDVSRTTVKVETPEFDMDKFGKDNEAAQKKHIARQELLEETKRRRLELAAKQQEIEKQKAQEIERMRELLTAKGKSLPPEIEESMKEDVKSEETESLLAQLKALEDEATSLGLDSELWFSGGRGSGHRGRGSHRGWRGHSSRGRGRGGFHRGGVYRGGVIANGAYNLDNRPKTVKAEGIEFDDSKEESLKRYLLTLGEYVSVHSDSDRKSLTISFRDRPAAEAFFYGPKDIPGVGKLAFSWVALARGNGVSNKELDTEMNDAGQVVDGGFKQLDTSNDEEVQRDDEADGSDEEYEWIT